MRGKGRAVDALVIVLLAVGAFVVWKWRIIDTATEPYWGGLDAGDFWAELYPGTMRAAAWWRAGIVPLWNPYQFCGHPYLATGIYGVLYPLNFLHLFLPSEVALEATIVMHLAIGGILMFAFARVLGLARPAAIGAGVVFLWSGFFVGEALWFPSAVASGTWLPLGLLAIEKIVRTRRVVWSAILAVAIALAFMGGWPQSWMYSLYALGVFAAVRIAGRLRTSAAEAVHVAALVGFGFVLSGPLMAVQLLPQLELQRLGPRRVGGLSAEQAVLLAPASPRWFLDQVLDSQPGGLKAGYVGVATLLAVALSVFAADRRGAVLAFWVIGLFSAGVALGVTSPLFQVHRTLPGMAWFRGPQRILYLYAVAAAVLAGIGLDVLMRARDGSSGTRRVAMLVVVVALAAIGGVAVAMPEQSLTYLVCGTVLCGAALVSGSPRLRGALVLSLVALVAWDLYRAVENRALHPYHDLSVYDGEKALWSFVEEHQRFDRTYIKSLYHLPAITPKMGTMREIYSITDYEPLTLRRYERFYRILESSHRPSAFTFMGDLLADPTIERFRLIDLMSVRFIIAKPSSGRFRQPLDSLAWAWRPHPELPSPGGYRLYENTNVLPRSYVAYDARYVSTEDEAFNAVSAPGFEPRISVVIEDTAAGAASQAALRPITPARIVRYDPTEVVVEADANSPGHLVLTDTFYPGWTATVDGIETSILQANYLFRAVAVGAGRHTVAFRYTPASFRLGLAVTMLSLLLVGAIVLHDRRSRSSRFVARSL